MYAGRDQKSGGTWLGIGQAEATQSRLHEVNAAVAENQQCAVSRQTGRWAAVLNFRDTVQATPEQQSRGMLVTDFLLSELSPMQFARQLELQAYAGFNLIVGNHEQAVIVNNRGHAPTALPAGLHIVSNGQPEAGWFKSQRLRGRVRQEVLPLIAQKQPWTKAAFAVLSDTTPAPSLAHLPDTGMPTSLEQALSAVCIDTPELPDYGTRTQSILTMQTKAGLTDTDATAAGVKLTLISREYATRAHDELL